MRYDVDLFIDGSRTAGAAERRFDVVAPATEELLGSAVRADAADVDRAVMAAESAFRAGWRLKKPAERCALLLRFAALLRERADAFAEVESLDTGKPLGAARNEVLRAVRYFEYYAGAADKFLGDTSPMEAESFDFTLVEPLGVTAHITPWNFPLPVFARSAAPALAMGNTVVAKPAEQAPLTTVMAAELAMEAGFPPGVVNVVTGFGEEAGAPLVRHPGVRAVAFTGSVETGKRILHLGADRVIPVFPELGGKSPNLVFADADLEWAAANAATAVFANAGQACIAGARLLVEESVKDEFVERVVEKARAYRLGEDLGPMISREHLERVLGYIESGKQEGARVVTGGARAAAPARGYFVEPTVFDRVSAEMRIAREEIFGPVLCVFSFASEAEAVAMANDTPFGLAAGVFTRDLGRALRVSREIDAGRIYVNQYPSGDVTVPFGGNKESGYGRACGMEALRHFTQLKSVSVRYQG